jgi:hypothetical protein
MAVVSAPDCDTSASVPGAGIEPEQRPLHAQPVGAEQVQAFAPCDALQLQRGVGVDAVAQQQGGAAADAAGHLERRRQLGRRQCDQRQIGARLGQFAQRALRADVQVLRRHRQIAGRERQRLAQQPRLSGLQRGLLVGAGEDDQRARRKERGENVAVHGASG